jgi:hypothetical protein
MIHGDDKAKEMARSILPSRSRKGQAYRASIHRSMRREVNLSLRRLERDPSEWDEGVEFGEGPARELPSFVSQRRGQDKLNHFERWAIERTKEMPKEHRLGHLRSLLPGGLIGQHAMLHLKHREELNVERFRPIWGHWHKLLMDRGEVAELLRRLIEVGNGVRKLHEAMNKAVRAEAGGWGFLVVAQRKLLGVHDVLPFLDWLGEHRTERFVVDAFCKVFKETGDPDLALSRTVVKSRIPIGDTEWIRR